jgi:hypothetical protein
MYSLNGTVLAVGANIFDFCFVLPSAIFGSMAGKAIPLGACNASSFYIELELETQNNMFAYTSGAAALTLVSVSDVVFNAKVAVLPEDVNNMLMSSVMNRIVIPSTSWKVEQKSMSDQATSFNDKFAFQLSSVNAFLFWFHNQAAQDKVQYRSMTSRPAHKVSDYQLNINGETYPSDVIRTRSRMIVELQRAFDTLGTTKSGCGILDSTTYGDGADSLVASDVNTAAMPHKRTVYGIDLNRFNNSQETMLSGTSTIGQSVNLIFNKSGVVAENSLVYGAVMYDVIFTVENGLMTANT